MTKEVAAGMTIEVNATLMTTKTMSAITAANPAVATLEASHGVAQGEYGVILTSGWARIRDRIFRAETVATNDVTLAGGFDTSFTQFFPGAPSAGAGTVAELDASGWKQLTEIDTDGLEIAGGDRAVETLTPLDMGGIQVDNPTTESPYRWTLPFYENAGEEGWYSTLKQASERGTKVALRISYPSGFKIAAYCKVHLSAGPSQSGFNVPRGRVIFYAQGQISRFNS